MDEQIYTKALEEFDSDLRNKDLWIKALTLCNGDEKSAKYTYIKLYVEKASVTQKLIWRGWVFPVIGNLLRN